MEDGREGYLMQLVRLIQRVFEIMPELLVRLKIPFRRLLQLLYHEVLGLRRLRNRVVLVEIQVSEMVFSVL